MPPSKLMWFHVGRRVSVTVKTRRGITNRLQRDINRRFQSLPQLGVDRFAGTERRYGDETRSEATIHRWRLGVAAEVDVSCAMRGRRRRRRWNGAVRLSLRVLVHPTPVPPECR